MLGKLEKVEIRDIWPREDQDFTPWLAQPDNLQILSEVLGFELELEAQEQNVGLFRADLLCKDVSNDSWVLIENQLDKTDHTHLGQILTYASGLQAFTIIWIAGKFTDEHRATLDWLNEITEEQFQFFGLEVEVWKIGNSDSAPKFNVVSKPNGWSKSVKENARILSENDLSEIKLLQREYWTHLREFLVAEKSILRPQKPSPQHWCNFKIGRSHFGIFAAVNTRDKRLTVGLSMTGNFAKNHFSLLQQEAEKIESEFGAQLIWREFKEGKESKVECILENANPLQKSDWPRQNEWFKVTLEKFNSIFRNRVKELNVSDEI